MRIEVVVPQIGEAVAELTLVEWYKAEGEEIRVGEPLFAVDSDKSIVEVESFAGGTLAEILSPAGSSVLPMQVVAVIQAEGEETPAPEVSPAADGVITPPKEAGQASPVASLAVGRGTGERLAVTPRARRLARERGIDLGDVMGTGEDGMITVSDIETVRANSGLPFLAGEILPLSKSRRVTADRMAASKQQVPHFYLSTDVDVTDLAGLRDHCLHDLGWQRKPSYTEMMVRACGITLGEMPQCNVIYTPEGLIQRASADVGIAVQAESGLIVPVLAGVEGLSLAQVSQQAGELVERAREGRLRQSDMGSKSMVVSNLGMYRVDTFLAIIDMPDPMILAVGRITDRLVPLEGQPAVRSMCTLSLSVDHRALDGVLAAGFLGRVAELLESPHLLLE